MKSFVSLLFIVLLAFFDYNMDMLKGRGMGPLRISFRNNTPTGM